MAKRHSLERTFICSLCLFQCIHTEFDFSIGETESLKFQLRKWTLEFNIYTRGSAFPGTNCLYVYPFRFL